MIRDIHPIFSHGADEDNAYYCFKLWDLGEGRGSQSRWGCESCHCATPCVCGYSTWCGALPSLRSVADAEVVVVQQGD